MMEHTTNNPIRSRRKNDEILGLLNEFEKRGLTVKEFCVMYNISRATFHKWQSRYGNKIRQRAKPTGFAEVHVFPSGLNNQGSIFAEVNGIKIYQPVTAAYLKDLLQ